MKLYVTKWAATRGILVLEGSRPEKRQRDLHYRSWVKGAGRRMNMVFIGRDAHYTIGSAREDAIRRIEDHYKKTYRDYTRALVLVNRLNSGREINIHRNPESVSACKTFK